MLDTRLRWVRSVTLPIVLLAMAGCTTLPRSGPDGRAIIKSATYAVPASAEDAVPYVLVDLAPNIVKYAPSGDRGSIYSSFGGGRGPAPTILVGVGDTVQVTVFESEAGGLFVPEASTARQGNYVTLPPQPVDRDGTISVPYAGQIAAAGRSTAEIRREIESKLQARAIEPQVIVDIVDRRASQVTVAGEVAAAITFPVNPAGDRMLDAISRAGGTRAPAYETYVTLTRGARQATIRYTTLVNSPQENIFVAPGDTIYVSSSARTFLAFGASGENGQFNFGAADVSLLEGVGKAGGLLDGRADPGQVFLYRMESKEALANMGVVLPADTDASAIPTIYRTNLRDPAGFFLAQRFPMQNEDILYISNADFIELTKVVALIGTVTGTPALVTGNAAATKSAITALVN